MKKTTAPVAASATVSTLVDGKPVVHAANCECTRCKHARGVAAKLETTLAKPAPAKPAAEPCKLTVSDIYDLCVEKYGAIPHRESAREQRKLWLKAFHGAKRYAIRHGFFAAA